MRLAATITTSNPGLPETPLGSGLGPTLKTGRDMSANNHPTFFLFAVKDHLQRDLFPKSQFSMTSAEKNDKIKSSFVDKSCYLKII